MALLSIDSVSKTFVRGSHGFRVLREVSLDVDAGVLVGIYGPQASGKTTLLEIAAGLAQPDTGRVFFDGVDLGELSAEKRSRLFRRSIAWVDRHGPRGDGLSIVEYVSLPILGHGGPRFKEAQKEAAAALDRLDAGGLAGARWSVLSDTERMQVAIAHAIVRRPRLLVVDDPTAGLGVIQRERVMGHLRQIADESNVAILCACPDQAAVVRAHMLRMLHRGRLIGPPEPPQHEGRLLQFPGGGEEKTA